MFKAFPPNIVYKTVVMVNPKLVNSNVEQITVYPGWPAVGNFCIVVQLNNEPFAKKGPTVVQTTASQNFNHICSKLKESVYLPIPNLTIPQTGNSGPTLYTIWECNHFESRCICMYELSVQMLSMLKPNHMSYVLKSFVLTHNNDIFKKLYMMV